MCHNIARVKAIVEVKKAANLNNISTTQAKEYSYPKSYITLCITSPNERHYWIIDDSNIGECIYCLTKQQFNSDISPDFALKRTKAQKRANRFKQVIEEGNNV